MLRWDVVLWSVMIGVYVENGYGIEVFEIFYLMKCSNIELDGVMYINFLNVCGYLGVLDVGMEIYI